MGSIPNLEAIRSWV